jgi:signal peptidase I
MADGVGRVRAARKPGGMSAAAPGALPLRGGSSRAIGDCNGAGEARVSGDVKAKADKESGGWWDTIKLVLEALAIALVIRTLLFQPFNIPSGSLVPTLLVGDYLFVSKYTYGYSRHSMPFSPNLFSGRIWGAEPKRGDIAVFKLPKDGSTDYIKRVIGMPGDRRSSGYGRLHINNQIVPRERIADYEAADVWGRMARVAQYRETLPGGVAHVIIERDGDRGYWDNTKVYTVPPGHYFMMGDNRDNSTDSRDESSVGPVPYENFVGRAEIIFFSIEEGESALQFWKWPSTVRWGRLLQPIR